MQPWPCASKTLTAEVVGGAWGDSCREPSQRQARLTGSIGMRPPRPGGQHFTVAMALGWADLSQSACPPLVCGAEMGKWKEPSQVDDCSRGASLLQSPRKAVSDVHCGACSPRGFPD